MIPHRVVLPVFALVACSTPVADVGGLTGDSGGSPGAVETSAAASSGTGSTDIGGSGGVAETSTSAPAESSGSDDGGPKLDVGGGSGPASCVGGTDLVWLLFEVEVPAGAEPEVYLFDPSDGSIDFVATVDCVEGFERYWSLSVDKDGSIFTFGHAENDPFNQINAGGEVGDCTVHQVTDAPSTFLYPGMPFDHAFVAPDPADLEDEEIYVHDYPQNDVVDEAPGEAGKYGRLTIVDGAVTIEVLAETSYDVGRLAGTGDGRLFGLVRDEIGDLDEVPRLVELDVADGSITTEIVSWPKANTFAFFEGDLIVFELDAQARSTAFRYDLDDDDGSGVHEITQIVGPDGFPEGRGLFGAASPTCIPTTPAG